MRTNLNFEYIILRGMKACILFFTNLSQFDLRGQNLLVNGGFEEENICTEYKVNCAPEAWLTNDDVFFNYFKDVNRAHTGDHCMAFEAGHAKKPFKRTFIRSQLLCGLRSGNKYLLEFFVKSPHPILDSIGVCFTYYDFLFGNEYLQNIKPSFYLVDASMGLKTDSSWQHVQITYEASGNEAFISIANFSKRDITGTTGIEMENNFFVFVDDVSLIPVNPSETICNDWQKARETIYNQDERHEFLRRKIKAGKLLPHEKIILSANKIMAIDSLILPDLLFETGKADLMRESYVLLDSLCNKIKNVQVDSIVITGHTDSIGGYELNEKLSIARANSVKAYLQEKTNYSAIITRGLAFRNPLTSNQTPEGRKKNRRVEVFLYTRE